MKRNSRRVLALLFAAVLTPALTCPSGAQPVAGRSPRQEVARALMAKDALLELAPKADAIAVVTMSARRSFWSPSHDLILTEYVLVSQRAVVGKAPASMTIVEEGGEVEGVGLWVSDALAFEPNASYVVLLQNRPGGPQVLGAVSGVRKLTSPNDPLLSSLEYVLAATGGKEQGR